MSESRISICYSTKGNLVTKLNLGHDGVYELKHIETHLVSTRAKHCLEISRIDELLRQARECQTICDDYYAKNGG